MENSIQHVGIAREKKEDLRVQIQRVQSEIDELRKSGDKYNQLPEKLRYLETLKIQWQQLDTTLGKISSSAVRESAEELQTTTSNNKVNVNKEEAMMAYYIEMHNVEKQIIMIKRAIANEQDPIKKVNLVGKLSKLEESLETLKNYSEFDVIAIHKAKLEAYNDAKGRYKELSAMEKIKAGKLPTWKEIAKKPEITEIDLYMKYQQRGR